nr:Arm DNA-binding domain-containing protein [Odoribacter lunatus]
MGEEKRRTTFSVLFYIKRQKLLKNGEAPICMRLTVNKQKAEIMIKRSIPAELWNQAGKNGKLAPLKTEESAPWKTVQTDHRKTVEVDHLKTLQIAPPSWKHKKLFVRWVLNKKI